MYPLKFRPVFQQRIWGGHRLYQVLGRPVPPALRSVPLGESWELADLPPGAVQPGSAGAAPDGSLSSVIANGPRAGQKLHEVIGANVAAVLGTGASNGYFPLLIKFLDARENLSVQVHPDAGYMQTHPGTHLKSEAWYVLAAQPGGKIYRGLKPGVDRDTFRAALGTGRVEPLLNAIVVRPGECHYLPSGLIHALGAGVLVAEVQTPSDTTFRVFDWNRLDAAGRKRELHVEQALEVLRWDSDARPQPERSNMPAQQDDAFLTAQNAQDRPISASRGARATSASAKGVDALDRETDGVYRTELVNCPHFSLSRASLSRGSMELAAGRPSVWIGVGGQGVIECQDGPAVAFTVGDTLLLPAGIRRPRLTVVAACSWLEANVP